jgi:eukaryotic-like serine/threonine-protein kinase
MRSTKPSFTKEELRETRAVLGPLAEPLIEKGYKILGLLNEGGMGKVYAADDGNEMVTVKVMRDNLRTDHLLRRFALECTAPLAINHPNVIRTLDSHIGNEGAFLITEFIPGVTLHELLGGTNGTGRLYWENAARLTIDLCDGLGAIHDLGMLHRDLKPANIMFGNGRTIKIIDFGLCHIGGCYRDEEIMRPLSLDMSLTQPGDMLGTPHYMAPEQNGSGFNYGFSCDTYSLGIILYEMISGRKPFTGRPDQLHLAKLMDSLQPPSTIVPTLPPEMDDFLSKALRANPKHRYLSAGEMRRDLEGILEIFNGSDYSMVSYPWKIRALSAA